jgi:NAD(P)-dependent dehydrogenase (short-subunit alcohol dehydrogenase family)
MGSVTCHSSRPTSLLAESSPDLLLFGVEFGHQRGHRLSVVFVFETLLKLIPYGRIGEPDDVARAAVWLASDESEYISGTSHFIDAGMTLYLGFGDNTPLRYR